MSAKMVLLFVVKLVVCSLGFVVGMMVGGMVAMALALPVPELPPEMNLPQVMTLMLASTPLLVVALVVVNRHLTGGWLARSAMLFLLSWIAYSVNNVIEGIYFTTYQAATLYTVVNFMPALLFCAAVTAWLFPAHPNGKTLGATWQAFFRARSRGQWAWRLVAAGVVFMPIYYLFGLMVVPVVGSYYAQGGAGLTVPPLATLLGVLLVRSLLFFVACLPVVVAWQGGRLPLVWALGFALFVLVGLLYMLAATWIAPHIRFAHSLEILADSLAYAGALVWLLSSSVSTSKAYPKPKSIISTPL